ncbi:hypothetical protein HG535_0G00920 [Zygotorulaspora mrakii]|uniref:Major facilitator superfamily (MFS) profile domain-containing protein n=1 Tax=Zygotorulaspora mrakii TaxID=42260 RepID=A0A7H9B652_ZYGMR|nr:uncharacterized protein HG535_0G00920 [Zygotorulaspora mrakii]QLG74208.1 hypothetical protein HG535_0G00920 [Zygotorulaspora mrakii]
MVKSSGLAGGQEDVRSGIENGSDADYSSGSSVVSSSTGASSTSGSVATVPRPLHRGSLSMATGLGAVDSAGSSISSMTGSRMRRRSRRQSAISEVSNSNQSMALSLTRTVTKIIKAVQDDNRQSAQEKNDLNKVLESRFDVGDALQLEENKTESVGAAKASEPFAETGKRKGKDKLGVAIDHDVERLPYKGEAGEEEEENEDVREEDDDADHATIKKVFTNKSTGAVDLPPDGGYGWVVTFCVSLIMFSTWGCNSGFGVFLAFYLNANYYPGGSKYDYALIAGMTVAFGQGLSPFVMSVMRIIGFKPTMIMGAALMLAGFLLASFSTQLWQLYLTQGFLYGVSISFIFVPATTVLPGWFLKKRAVALGLSLLGTGAGGVTYGLAANRMIQEYGNPRWAYRILGISCTISVLFSVALIKQRKPISRVGFKSIHLMIFQFKQMFALSVVKNPFVPLIALWFMCALFGYTLMIFTLSSYAVARGMSQHQGSILTAVLNGAQSVGRPLMGLAGDQFGRANVTIVLTSALSIMMFAFWIPIHTFVQMLMFAICVGSCVGVANVMSTVLIADLVLPDQFLASWSFVNYFGAPFLLISELVAQALTVETDVENPYLHTQCFAGACFSGALILILILRELAVKKKLLDRQNATRRKIEEWKLDPTSVLDDDWEPLMERREKYDILLGPGLKRYFLRMAYPMKV